MSDRDALASAAIMLLAEAGLGVRVRSSNALDITDGDRVVRVDLKTRRNATYEWDALQMLGSAQEGLLIVVPHASASLIDVAKQHPRLSVASIDDGLLVWNGRTHTQPQSTATALALHRRSPWGRWAVLRTLIRTDEPRTQAQLAHEAGISQPAVSNTLSSLGEDVRSERRGWRPVDRGALWDRFDAEYRGAGGITASWYGLDPVTEQTTTALDAARTAGVTALASGDSGADAMAPWRIPSRAVVYAMAGVDLAPGGLAETTTDRATLDLIVPADRTLWATAQAWAGSEPAQTADPAITGWDVRRIGGPDADEAARHIRDVALRGEWR
ncbi:hypothetical protein [Agromyces archimandritae]|uniref:Uncharacterized protein n=1 Tax=Agromyces archimandritae TaxID=2781962 RepID=A0A975FJD6_9MICO|nr:hypothetical protein [Agromyces archimandritae]QTX03603.1 hypothetical protein G127AT_09625 [Agromyces archimandritae]